MKTVSIPAIPVLLALLWAPAFADEPPAALRVGQVTDEGAAMGGLPQQAPCPAAGCQVTTTLVVAGGAVAVNAIVTFVPRGLYLAIEPARGVTARIREYGTARPEPIFIPKARDAAATRVIRLSVEGGVGAKAAVRSYTGAQPDAYLRVEIGAMPTG